MNVIRIFMIKRPYLLFIIFYLHQHIHMYIYYNIKLYYKHCYMFPCYCTFFREF
jgi:hypothetical protein